MLHPSCTGFHLLPQVQLYHRQCVCICARARVCVWCKRCLCPPLPCAPAVFEQVSPAQVIHSLEDSAQWNATAQVAVIVIDVFTDLGEGASLVCAKQGAPPKVPDQPNMLKKDKFLAALVKVNLAWTLAWTPGRSTAWTWT